MKTEILHISPIDHACETISAKNNELRNLISDPDPVLKLTQSLQGENTFKIIFFAQKNKIKLYSQN